MKFDFKKRKIDEIEDELYYLKRVVEISEGSLVDAKIRIKLLEDLIQEIKNEQRTD